MAEIESEGDFNPKKIFIGNLPFSVKSEDLTGLFSTYGRIIGVNVREDRLTGKPKGFAFITFESEDSAMAAISSMNNYSYDGRALTVKRANLRGTESLNKDSEKNAWKSVPTPSPAERKKAGTSAGGGAKGSKQSGGTTKKSTRPTWDTWVGPQTAKAPPKNG